MAKRDYAARRVGDITEPWTDARENDAHRLWFEGKSGAEIARALGGTSRSAVIGLANRRGWLRTGNKVEAQKVSSPKPVRVVARSARRVAIKTTPAPIPKRGDGITIIALTLTTCRYVVDATPFDQRYCGEACGDTEPYCAGHRRMCWNGLGVKVSDRGRR